MTWSILSTDNLVSSLSKNIEIFKTWNSILGIPFGTYFLSQGKQWTLSKLFLPPEILKLSNRALLYLLHSLTLTLQILMIWCLSLRILKLFTLRQWILVLDAHWNSLRRFFKCLGPIPGNSNLIFLRSSLGSGICKTPHVILCPAKLENRWYKVSNDLLNCTYFTAFCQFSLHMLILKCSKILIIFSYWKFSSLGLCDTHFI